MKPETKRVDEFEQQGDELRSLIATRLGIDEDSIECPRQRWYMTPCVAAHGGCALTDGGTCVGCGEPVGKLLKRELQKRSAVDALPEVES